MTLEQIMKLLDAGYTKEEINEFKDLQQSKEPEPQKDPEPEPEPKPGEDPEPKHYPDEISKLTEQVKALTESMQEHFRNAAEEKKTGALDGDNILKNILEKGEI